MSKRYFICDIDGTICKHKDRSPYDMTRVMDDEPKPIILELVLDLFASGYGVIFVSGRDYSARKATQKWIFDHTGLQLDDDYYLFMRGVGDGRPDHEIKQEIYNDMIKDNFENIKFILDDRDQVVKMWRDNGLTCLQVDYGNF